MAKPAGRRGRPRGAEKLWEEGQGPGHSGGRSDRSPHEFTSHCKDHGKFWDWEQGPSARCQPLDSSSGGSQREPQGPGSQVRQEAGVSRSGHWGRGRLRGWSRRPATRGGGEAKLGWGAVGRTGLSKRYSLNTYWPKANKEGRKEEKRRKKEEGRRKKPHRCHGRGNQTKLEPQRRPGRRPGAGHGQQAGGSPESLDGAAAGRFAGAARTSRAGTDTTVRQTPTTSRARGPWAPCPAREDGQLNPTCGPSDGSICGRLSSLGNSESSRTRRHGGGEDPGPGPRVDGDAGVEDQPRPGPELDPEPATHPLRL